jgi:hypothetical protein
VYGYLNVFNQDILDNKKNNVFSFSTRDKYIGYQLESFNIDNLNLELTADSSIYSDITKFLLRRVLYYTSKIYLGNGTIGYYDANSKTLQYSCISYDVDILDRIDQIPTLYSNSLILDRKEIILNPSFEPDVEQVRNISRFYPVDGRIVQDSDYKTAALKYFGEYLYDVLSYNSDTDQEVTLLIRNSFTPQTQSLIAALFASRMALGIRVNIYTKQSTDGKVFTFNCNVAAKDAYTNLYTDVIGFVNNLTFQFLKTDQIITAANRCLQLSANFGIVFTPTGTEAITVLKDDFFSAIDINITLV